MKKVFAVTAVLALLCLGGLAQANISIDTVAIGDAGNAADTASHSGNPSGQGSVSYNYNIGKYEVTAGQYTTFLNAKAKTDTYGLYNTYMADTGFRGCNIQRTGSAGSYTYTVASDWANKPVNYVSYWDACRFANWLGNGQGNGDTETGAYTLGGYNGPDGRTIQRNTGWTWAVTSEDEWYKAAYYKGGGGYSLYANGTSTAPGVETDSNYGGTAPDGTYLSVWDGTINGALEQNGTKDMMGNVWELNQAIPYISGTYAYRGLRGGSFSTSSYDLQAVDRYYADPTRDYDRIGFRVSYVPEPSSIIALLGGLVGLLGIRRRRA
jgi:sulfatase modifying factor 1